MENNTLEIKQLRKRFVSDFNLPIQVIHSPYFEDRLNLLEGEFNAKSKYESLLNMIAERFDNSTNKFLEHYKFVRNNIIESVIATEAYKDFISSNKYIKKSDLSCSNTNLYTHEQDGCFFISYDMKKANFQTLKYANPSIVFNANTYEDFIGMFTDLDYIKESKYTRQVIFGKMNPSRTINLETYITSEFAKWLIENNTNDKLELFAIKSDEVIFKFNGSEDEFNSLEIKNEPIIYDGIEYKSSKFKLKAIDFKLANSSALLSVYEKEDYLNGHKRILKGVPATYYAQVYKILNGIEINDSDLIFYYEHELAKLLNPIELIKKY